MPPKKVITKHEKAVHSKTALLLIDIQSAFRVPEYFGTARNNPKFEENVEFLVTKCREYAKRAADMFQIDIIHVHHHSTSPASPLHPDFVLPDEPSIHGIDPLPCAAVQDGEAVFRKSVNSAFIGTKLEAHLRKRGIRQLFICGLTTDHCVSTTVRMAANLGVVDESSGPKRDGLFSPAWSGKQGSIFLVEDACATFGKGEFSAEMIHKVHVQSLKDEFAEITTVDDTVEKVLAGKKIRKVTGEHRAALKRKAAEPLGKSPILPPESGGEDQAPEPFVPPEAVGDESDILAEDVSMPDIAQSESVDPASPEFVSIFGQKESTDSTSNEATDRGKKDMLSGAAE